MNETLKTRIDDMIKSGRIVVFMKGSAAFPMCGFSGRVVELLKAAGADKLTTFDVLRDAELREGIKVYSNWATLPQVYIDGKFVGGCDIVTDLYDTGDLSTMVAPKQ